MAINRRFFMKALGAVTAFGKPAVAEAAQPFLAQASVIASTVQAVKKEGNPVDEIVLDKLLTEAKLHDSWIAKHIEALINRNDELKPSKWNKDSIDDFKSMSPAVKRHFKRVLGAEYEEKSLMYEIASEIFRKATEKEDYD